MTIDDILIFKSPILGVGTYQLKLREGNRLLLYDGLYALVCD